MLNVKDHLKLQRLFVSKRRMKTTTITPIMESELIKDLAASQMKLISPTKSYFTLVNDDHGTRGIKALLWYIQALENEVLGMKIMHQQLSKKVQKHIMDKNVRSVVCKQLRKEFNGRVERNLAVTL
jgi:hypothetical protein